MGIVKNVKGDSYVLISTGDPKIDEVSPFLFIFIHSFLFSDFFFFFAASGSSA